MISPTNPNKIYSATSISKQSSSITTTTDGEESVNQLKSSLTARSGETVTISSEGRLASSRGSVVQQPVGQMSVSKGAADGEGKKILQDRLFGGVNSDVALGSSGMSSEGISKSPYAFLTKDDRDLLASIYSSSKSQGVDLNYVDDLAGELGEYRKHDSGRLSVSFNNGMNFDASGHKLTVSYNQDDSDTASRILNGKAFSSTELDKGFLNHILDPGFGALSNTSNLKFLEKVVIQTSGEANSDSGLGDDFSSYSPVRSIKDNVKIMADPVATLAPFEPDLKNENGTWVVTEKGRASGVTLDQWKKHVAGLTLGESHNTYILDAISANKTSEKPRQWLSSLFKGFNI